MNHHLANYLIGGTALLVAGGAAVNEWPVTGETRKHNFQVDSAITHIAPSKHSRLSWPGLVQDETIALGELLGKKPHQLVTLFCSSVVCAAIRADFDDALQIAGWESSFEDRPVDSEAEKGLFVGPPGKPADAVIADIYTATGLVAKSVPIDGLNGLGVIFGKKPR